MLIPNNKKLYDPTSDSKVEITNAVKKAKKEGKHVFFADWRKLVWMVPGV